MQAIQKQFIRSDRPASSPFQILIKEGKLRAAWKKWQEKIVATQKVLKTAIISATNNEEQTPRVVSGGGGGKGRRILTKKGHRDERKGEKDKRESS